MKLSCQLVLTLAFLKGFSAQECSTTWTCRRTTNAPDLDGDHSDWEGVEAYTTNLLMTSGTPYDAGQAVYKCLHDDENIYFAFEIPGYYRFNSTNNHLCAAIGTMFKIGSKATFMNMGGCPDAMGGCPSVPETCDEYRVDIGAHWELSGTQQGVAYGVNTGTGDDAIANKDDEYAVSPYCRFDDDDANAANEWSGAWKHSNPVEGEFGNYHFEMSRSLKTPSSLTDAQLTPGETYQFGVAFWDPFESEDMGWSDIGHYLTGCAMKWIDLELSNSAAPEQSAPDLTDATILTQSASAGMFGFSTALVVTVAIATLFLTV